MHRAAARPVCRCRLSAPGQGAEFLLQVHRLAERIQAEKQRRIFRLPVFGAIATVGQIRWQLVAVAEQVGIDPACVHLEKALEPWRCVGILLGGALLEVGGAHQAVDVERFAARQFRQAALGQQAHGDHLFDAVAGMHIAQAEKGVMETAAFDQRCAHGIAPHRDVLCQALERLHAAGGWHAALVAAGLAAGQPKQAEQRGSGGEPRAEVRKGGGGHGKGSCRARRVCKGAKVVSAQAPCKVPGRFICRWRVKPRSALPGRRKNACS